MREMVANGEADALVAEARLAGTGARADGTPAVAHVPRAGRVRRARAVLPELAGLTAGRCGRAQARRA